MEGLKYLRKQSLIDLSSSLRKRLVELRSFELSEKQESSIHINAVEMAVCLVEFAIKEQRKIKVEEESWFEASYYVDQILGGSEWEDIHDMYYILCEKVKLKDFFR